MSNDGSCRYENDFVRCNVDKGEPEEVNRIKRKIKISEFSGFDKMQILTFRASMEMDNLYNGHCLTRRIFTHTLAPPFAVLRRQNLIIRLKCRRKPALALITDPLPDLCYRKVRFPQKLCGQLHAVFLDVGGE